MHLTVKAVIFDMDGVITDTMPYHYRAWKMVFAHYGVKVSHLDIYSREGQKGIDSVREICAEQGIVFDAVKAQGLLIAKEELFKRIFKRRFIAGSRFFLQKLFAAGFRLALVTGTSRHEAVRLLPKDIFDLFSVTVCGSDVHNGKPHPEPYLTALKKLKIRKKQAVVIENAPFGVRSAKAAGICCLGLSTSLPKDYLKAADAVFSSFKDLNQAVRFIKG